MTKRDIVKLIAKKTRLDYLTINKVISLTISIINKNLENDEIIYLRGFGTISTKLLKSKKARDIHKNKVIILPERKKKHIKWSSPYIQSEDIF